MSRFPATISGNERTTSFIAKYEAIAEQSLDKLNDRLQDDSVTAKDLITIAGISTEISGVLTALTDPGVNIAKVNDTDVTGSGTSGDPWGP